MEVISSIQENCAFHFSSQVINRKWNTNIVLEFITSEDTLSFSEIAQRIPEISPRMLSMRIKSLVDLGILALIENPDKPKKVRYKLTEAGQELSHVLHVIRNWSIKYGDCKNEICLSNQCRHGLAINKLMELTTLNAE